MEHSVIEWKRLLLTKFPSFDPTWGEECMEKWFECFYDVLKL